MGNKYIILMTRKREVRFWAIKKWGGLLTVRNIFPSRCYWMMTLLKCWNGAQRLSVCQKPRLCAAVYAKYTVSCRNRKETAFSVAGFKPFLHTSIQRIDFMNILTHVVFPFKCLCEYQGREMKMSTVSDREKQTQYETLAIDRETLRLLRQYQEKTGQNIEMLLKQAVETMYSAINQ